MTIRLRSEYVTVLARYSVAPLVNGGLCGGIGAGSARRSMAGPKRVDARTGIADPSRWVRDRLQADILNHVSFAEVSFL